MALTVHAGLDTRDIHIDLEVVMTKKDYILLAHYLKNCKPEEKTFIYSWKQTVNSVADALQVDSSRFNRERFLTACGVTHEDQS